MNCGYETEAIAADIEDAHRSQACHPDLIRVDKVAADIDSISRAVPLLAAEG